MDILMEILNLKFEVIITGVYALGFSREAMNDQGCGALDGEYCFAEIRRRNGYRNGTILFLHWFCFSPMQPETPVV
jgi:hypothetical protein